MWTILIVNNSRGLIHREAPLHFGEFYLWELKLFVTKNGGEKYSHASGRR